MGVSSSAGAVAEPVEEQIEHAARAVALFFVTGDQEDAAEGNPTSMGSTSERRTPASAPALSSVLMAVLM
ncbi:hypothetical protein [Streptomyces sp. F001]|uniref:hypothetical protein n=1 Tax=Streptomyces sp. F001 TaxID=1510026 RepID=UPI0013EEAE8E|nr:hypothetical protein [Streptomyces sp. F001]